MDKEENNLNREPISYDEAMNQSMGYFDGGSMEASNFLNKYALREGEEKVYEYTPDHMHKRLAGEFHRIEKKYPNETSEDKLYELMKDFEGPVPQGSVMSACGNPFQVMSLSNCFVVRETDADSYGNILKTDQELAQIMKRRGGVGTDLSHLRPRGTKVQNAARTSTGAASFAHRYSDTTREVAQNNRRGALMLTIDCRHPDVEEFVNLKAQDETAVTGANISVKVRDEFMEAVEAEEEYTLRWPVECDPDEADVTKTIDAKELFQNIVKNNYGPGNIPGGEPGTIWIDQIHRESPANQYPGMKEISTNPCLTGDTQVWVADGRGAVDFETLAKEGRDVPVYTKMNDGSLGVNTMRNPRITGKNKDVYEITLENGHSFKATDNHKLLSNENGYTEVKNLEEGESLHIGTSHYGSLSETFGVAEENREYYKLVKNSYQNRPKTEHRVIYEFHKGDISKNQVIHHKDFDSKNNDPENLIAMDREAHKELHRQGMMGEDNPYHKMCDKWQEDFASHPGEENGKYSGVNNKDFKKHAVGLAKNLGRRFTKWEWHSYAEDNNLPKTLSNFRRTDEYSNVTELGKWAAKQAGVSTYNELHAHTIKRISHMQSQGYDVRVLENNAVQVNRTCENCGDEFWIHSYRREQSYCSRQCASEAKTRNGVQDAAVSNMLDTKKTQAQEKRRKQLDVFTELVFELDRDPLMKEWKARCEEKGVSKRLHTKFGFDNYGSLKEHAKAYNHRVKSVEYAGEETVYNGTVDDTHNFYFGNWNEQGQKVFVNSLNCGEVPLPDGDACRLLAINLFAYVENPFEEDAYFDFERFAEEVRYSQRMMDDIVDLEIEAVDRILQKVKDDPEEEVVKGIEKHLWKRIKEQAINWRRTGLGTTALGDTLAALGYRYASDESFEVVDEIYRTLKLSAYRESVELAKERGAFPSWDKSVESDENPFLQRIKQEDPELFEDMMKHGRRNVAILTNAPTGTVSTLCQTTSGIENMYAPSFFRKRKINHDEDVEPDYVDETGDEWVEFPVFKDKFKLWMEKNGYDTDNVEQYSPEDVDRMKKESPYDGATVEDVDWRKKVELQGVIQRHIDHSISVTTNLPEDVPMDVVEDVYMRSWKSGCKGCTIFRDGSRDSVLSNESVKDQDGEITHTDAPERPEVLDCKIHQIRYRGDNWKILVGFLEEDPYEVFAIKTGGDTGVNIRFVNSDNEGFEQGRIRKHGGGVYDLEAKDGKVVIEDINSYAPDDEVRGMTRMLSLSLRHGTPIRYVIEQLEKADGSIVSFTRSVLQALRQYMPDGEEATNGETCSECGSENVIYVEGCLKCQDCGSGKCG